MRLVEGFQLLATAPDGIARLRELILNLAVMGKLVPQDPSDDSAGALLKKIRIEKDRLIAEGKVKRDKPLSDVGDEEKRFSLPAGWKWVRLNHLVSKLGAGSTPLGGKDVYVDQGIKFLRSQNVWNDGLRLDAVAFITPETHAEMAGTVVSQGDILFNITGASIGRCAIVPSEFDEANVSQHVAIVRPIVRDITPYLHLVLTSPHVQQTVMDVQVGVSREGLSMSKLGQFVIPVPPIPEQSRIVAKVDELMHLCDELENRGRLETEQHARLTATLFDALAASESSHALAENWARVAAHFDLLLDRPEAVDVLEQTISQLAIRGLLVPQESNDEPASELLQQIRTEKDRLIAEGKVKRDKPLPAITEDDKPFELPEQWEWVKTQDICAVITDGDHQAPPKAAEGVPFLVIGDVRWGSLDVASASRFVPDSYFEQLDWSKKPIAGDILYTTVGSFGIPVVVAEEMRFCFQRHIGLFRPAHITLQPFLNLVLASALVLQQASARATGIAQKTVPLSALRDFKIPLLPIAEQHRIVARVVDLRRLCADLREHLTERRTCQARFAETIVGQTASAATLEDSDALAAA